MEDKNAPSKAEIQEVQKWLQANRSNVPEAVFVTLSRILFVYASLSQSTKKAKDMLNRLREAMGILPKSERGKTDKEAPESLPIEEMLEEDRAQYDKIKVKRELALKEAKDYQRALRILLPPPKNPVQLEFAFADAFEMVFSSPSSDRKGEERKNKVDRVQEFDGKSGLHSTIDKAKRIDLQILVTETTHHIETVTDPETGKSVRASMEDVGPEGSTMTWRAIANLVKLVIGFAIPMNRVSLLIGQPEFGTSQICRILKWVATLCLPIYLHLMEELSESGILTGDDTKTKILEVRKSPDEDSLANQIDEHLGFSSQRVDGTGDKLGLNVSLLMGRSVKADPRSTIALFRTHQGSVGNLLTRLLEWRTPKAGALIFQGDMSTTNLPKVPLRQKFKLTLAGCGAHARRPFWRYRKEDPLFCYFMLRGFFEALANREENRRQRSNRGKHSLHARPLQPSNLASSFEPLQSCRW